MPDVLTPLQRQAAFKAAVTLHEVTMAQAAARLGVSYNHLTLVLKGERRGSDRLERAIAVFVGQPRKEVFPDNTP
jgi:lambda repressor-like predicted transcriptional regulator